MSRSTYSAQCKKDAVAAYESRQASMTTLASPPGTKRNQLHNCVHHLATGVLTRLPQQAEAARDVSG
ncbi:hypothetical protein, partial [Actinobaculum suis]|uniref:hypothetical protein n=1 Tax=Actinobaculum suis TaxID=1657 RepID=UPI001E32AF63